MKNDIIYLRYNIQDSHHSNSRREAIIESLSQVMSEFHEKYSGLESILSADSVVLAGETRLIRQAIQELALRLLQDKAFEGLYLSRISDGMDDAKSYCRAATLSELGVRVLLGQSPPHFLEWQFQRERQ